MTSSLLLTAALFAVPVAGSAAAPDDETATGSAYVTGVLIVRGPSDEGVSTERAGGFDVEGARFVQPLRTDDPRLDGEMVIVSNAAGRRDPGGHGGYVESRTFRLRNEDGTWTGEGQTFRADGSEDDVPPTELGFAVLRGAGDYAGLTAYLQMELDWNVSVFEQQVRGFIIGAEPPPVPAPIPED